MSNTCWEQKRGLIRELLANSESKPDSEFIGRLTSGLHNLSLTTLQNLARIWEVKAIDERNKVRQEYFDNYGL